ncbi:MAG: 5-oxoprolinase subunit PxpB [Candidatus Limnocylindrales bacterium]
MTAAGAAGRNGRPTVEPFGDGACLVSYGGGLDVAVNERVLRLAAAVAADRDGGWGVPVPSFESLLVPYDAARLEAKQAAAHLRRLATSIGETAPLLPISATEPLEIPVRYGGQAGPDLEAVCAGLGLTSRQLIELHAGRTYRTWFLGFGPGFGYLGPLAPQLVTPRLATPRALVPAGSVGIAGEQTAVYPLATPGGWNLIGRTDLRLWDPDRDPPALLQPGREVRFVPLEG